MKKVNLPLLLGSIIIILLLLIMLFPNVFTDINPYGIRHLKAWTDEVGKFHLESAPFSPSDTSILGTDEIGRDIFSLIIHGTRLTITLGLLVVLTRFIVALPIGISAGFGSFVSKAVINQFSVIFSAIPSLLVSIILLKMDFFMNLYRGHSIIAFVLVLTFVGWAKLGMIIMERVQEIMAKPFIKGEIAIGKSKIQIAIQNVIPHLAAELVVLFFMEIARVLTIIMQLGIFGVFVGNLRVIEDSSNGVIKAMNISYEPEWASMLATARNQIRSSPWTVLSPAVAFFISVLGFNLFGEGLRKMLQQRNSQFIPKLRRLLSFKWTKLSYHSNNKRERTLIKRVIPIVLVVIILISWYSMEHKDYNFNYAQGTEVFNSSQPEQVIIGTDESKEMASQIAGSFKNLGIKPLDDDYIVEYETEDIYVPIINKFDIINQNTNQTLKNDKDYSLLSFGDFDLSGEVYDATEDDLINLKDLRKYNDKFIIINKSYYMDEAIEYFTEIILKKSTAKGVFTIIREDEELPNSIGKNIYGGIAIAITQEAGEILLENSQNKVNIKIESKQTNSVGRNIIGVIHGEDEQVGEEAIMFGFSYNYLDKEAGNNKILFAMEMIKKLVEQKENKNRTLIFAFWDGTLKDEYSGVNHYADHVMYPPKKMVLYFDLTKIKNDKVSST